MKRNLLATLADEAFIDQAKQLFSGAYFNAGWGGDYMLLAHEVPEEKLSWFRDKGILIKECNPLCEKKLWDSSLPVTTMDRFYLFTPEFKKWDNIVYLDADIIIRAPLEELTKVKGFAAVDNEHSGRKLLNQFSLKDKGLFNLLKSEYNLTRPAFNAGVMAFNTSIIDENTFPGLLRLLKQYASISRYGDQGILNLLFCGRWTKLPAVYNILAYFALTSSLVKKKNVEAIILHFICHFKWSEPWNKENDFYDEWMHNFKRADLIDLNRVNKVKKWPKRKVLIWSFYWKVLFFCDIALGLLGIFLKRLCPGLYSILQKLKQSPQRQC